MRYFRSSRKYFYFADHVAARIWKNTYNKCPQHPQQQRLPCPSNASTCPTRSPPQPLALLLLLLCLSSIPHTRSSPTSTPTSTYDVRHPHRHSRICNQHRAWNSRRLRIGTLSAWLTVSRPGQYGIICRENAVSDRPPDRISLPAPHHHP